MTTEIKIENQEIEVEDKELKLQDLEIKDEPSETNTENKDVKEKPKPEDKVKPKPKNKKRKKKPEDKEKPKPEDNEKPKPEDKEKYITLLKRFLHYTSEYLLYKPGDRFYQKSFSKANLGSLTKLVELESPKNIVDIIIKVKQDGTSVHPESVVFALALCTKYNHRVDLQREAYSAFLAICSDPEDFFLFMKFSRELNLPHLLGGKGWKRAVTKWYNKWTPFDLTQILTHHRRHFGWTHRDVVRLAHVKGNNPQQIMLMSFALRGYEATVKNFEKSDDQFVKDTLNYLTQWKQFVREKDMAVAAKKIEEELYPLQIIPHAMLKHQEIWNAILPRLEIKELVRKLQRISSLGFLRNNCLTVQIFIDSLDNYYSKQNCDIHPSEVFIALRTYENEPRICLEIAMKLKHPISEQIPPKIPPKQNPLIINALTSLYSDLFTMLKPTNKTYLIALDCRARFAQSNCLHCRHVAAAEAAHVITKTISSAESEDNVTVIGFGEKGNPFPIPIKKDLKLKEYTTTINEFQADGGAPDISKAIEYATTQKLDIDVFVVLTGQLALTTDTRVTLNSYRTDINKKEAKLVICSLTGKLKNHKDVDGEGILCIYGFDKKVCSVIEAFARGAF